jgi:hypothetical protein
MRQRTNGETEFRVLGRSLFRTELRVGNGIAQWSKPNRQREESGLTRQVKMPLRPSQELFGCAHHCRYTAEHFVDWATCSRIAARTFPLIRIENPSGGNTHFRPRPRVAAQSTRAPASLVAPARSPQPKNWIVHSCKTNLSMRLTWRQAKSEM